MAGRGRRSRWRTTSRPGGGRLGADRVGVALQQPGQVGFQHPQAVQLGADLGQLLAQRGLGVAAGTPALVGDLEQLADLPPSQPGPLGALDQPKPADRGLVVEAVAGRRPGRLGQQANALVVAHDVRAEAGPVGEGGAGEAVPAGSTLERTPRPSGHGARLPDPGVGGELDGVPGLPERRRGAQVQVAGSLDGHVVNQRARRRRRCALRPRRGQAAPAACPRRRSRWVRPGPAQQRGRRRGDHAHRILPRPQRRRRGSRRSRRPSARLPPWAARPSPA